MIDIIINNGISASIIIGSCMLLPMGQWLEKKFGKKS